jgi:hypothetical protein
MFHVKPWIERRREQKRLYMRAWRLARRCQPFPSWRSKAAVKGWSRRHWQRLKQETAEYDAWLDFKARSDARAKAWQEKRQRARERAAAYKRAWQARRLRCRAAD